jgi:hypothetical protein
MCVYICVWERPFLDFWRKVIHIEWFLSGLGAAYIRSFGWLVGDQQSQIRWMRLILEHNLIIHVFETYLMMCLTILNHYELNQEHKQEKA